MPTTSKKQYNYMQMRAHNPGKTRKMGGPSPAVAREMIMKTPKKKRSHYAKKDNPGHSY